MPAPRLLFMLTGSISCYKACHALSRLVQAGVEVRTVATPAALRFIGPATLEGLTGQPVYTDLWEPGRAMDHIEFTRWADLALIAPCTANTLNRLAAGLSDDLIGTLFLAWQLNRKPWWIAPAMNTAMLAHPTTQASLRTLADYGVHLLPTEEGSLACGEVGGGRLIDPDTLVMHVLTALSPKLA